MTYSMTMLAQRTAPIADIMRRTGDAPQAGILTQVLRTSKTTRTAQNRQGTSGATSDVLTLRKRHIGGCAKKRRLEDSCMARKETEGEEYGESVWEERRRACRKRRALIWC